MFVRVKICGITSAEVLDAAISSGADAVGFVFAQSPRQISMKHACELRARVSPFVSIVAVFRFPQLDDVRTVIQQFAPDVIQAEPVADVIQLVTEASKTFLPVLHDDGTVQEQLTTLRSTAIDHGGVLLEAAGRGGRGVAPNWDVAASIARQTPLVLAGGLTINNVGQAIRTVRPYAVDVSSGVESAPGHKDPEKIARFLEAVRHADRTDSAMPASA